MLIQIYANGESLASQNPDGKKSETVLTGFYRGFNSHRPLSSFEDTSKGEPSGAGGKSYPHSLSLNPCDRQLTASHSRQLFKADQRQQLREDRRRKALWSGLPSYDQGSTTEWDLTSEAH